jgi:hypothetical protein
MYLLKFLQEARDRAIGVEVEYRLACSGEFYNRKVQTWDWRKSDVARILLDQPFSIFVTSRPFDSYPQELCARMTLNFVGEDGGAPNARHSITFLPDDDVVEDLCAVLSLLSRRLVSTITKTREKHDDPDTPHWFPSDMPMPILDRPKVIAWRPKPGTVITGWDSQESSQTIHPRWASIHKPSQNFWSSYRACRMRRTSSMRRGSINRLLN